jgi:hypothetical protein
MPVTWGATSVGYGLMQSDTEADSVLVGEARDNTGKMNTRNTYSRAKNVNYNMITTGTLPEAGSTITHGGKTCLVESVEKSRENVAFQRGSLTATAHDSETLQTTLS